LQGRIGYKSSAKVEFDDLGESQLREKTRRRLKSGRLNRFPAETQENDENHQVDQPVARTSRTDSIKSAQLALKLHSFSFFCLFLS
jgi:hypothetical protein